MYFLVRPTADDTIVISVGSYLDFRNAPDFKVLLQDQLQLGMQHFILDFSETKSLDSSGLGTMFMLYRRMARDGGTIRIASASGTVETTIRLTGLSKVCSKFPDVEAALKAA